MARRSRPITAESLKELGIEPLPPDDPYYSSHPTITFTPSAASVAPNVQSDGDLTKAPEAGADVEASLDEHPDKFISTASRRRNRNDDLRNIQTR